MSSIIASVFFYGADEIRGRVIGGFDELCVSSCICREGLFTWLCLNAVYPSKSIPATDLSQLVQWLIRKSVNRPSRSCASIRVLMHLVTEETCLHSQLLIRVSEMLRITNVEDWERVCISLRLTGQEKCLSLLIRTNVQCQREGRCV